MDWDSGKIADTPAFVCASQITAPTGDFQWLTGCVGGVKASGGARGTAPISVVTPNSTSNSSPKTQAVVPKATNLPPPTTPPTTTTTIAVGATANGCVIGPRAQCTDVIFTVSLTGANFSGANLAGADLTGAQFKDVYLTNANLAGAIGTASIVGIGAFTLNGVHVNGATCPDGTLADTNNPSNPTCIGHGI